MIEIEANKLIPNHSYAGWTKVLVLVKQLVHRVMDTKQLAVLLVAGFGSSIRIHGLVSVAG